MPSLPGHRRLATRPWSGHDREEADAAVRIQPMSLYDLSAEKRLFQGLAPAVKQHQPGGARECRGIPQGTVRE